MTEQNKAQQPINIAAERAVLSGLCQHGNAAYTDVSELIDVDCFSETINQNVFKCLKEILAVANKPDYPTIIVKAKELGIHSLEQNQEYIVSLFNFRVQPDTIKPNCAAIRKLAFVRHAQQIVKDIYYKLSEVKPEHKLSDILSMVEEPVFEFANRITAGDGGNEKTEPLFKDVLAYIEHVCNNKMETIGIPSPWPEYNKAIGGGRRRGGVYMVAALAKVGKSTLAINDCIHCSVNLKIPTLYLDTELDKNSQLPKCLARLSKVPITDIEMGKLSDVQKDGLINLGKQLEKDIPLYYRQVGGKSFSEIISIIRNFVMQHVGMVNGIRNDCMICYDYFKLMDVNALKSLQEYQAIGFQIQELTDFCRRYDVPCASYVQLNREEEVAQSQRIIWLASSIAKLKRKSYEEMELDGFTNGNTKLIMCEQRFGPGLEDNDYINLSIQRDKCIVDEVCLKSQISKQNQGFESDDNDNDEQSESF